MNNLSEIRRVRREMSRAAGHDIRRLIERMNEARAQAAARIISPGSATEKVSLKKTSPPAY